MGELSLVTDMYKHVLTRIIAPPSSPDPSHESLTKQVWTTVEAALAVDTDQHRTVPRRPLRIIVLGGPGSDRSTVCRLLAQHFHLVHISAGGQLRAELARKSVLSPTIQPYMDNGLLVPDDVVNAVIRERILQIDSRKLGWVLDGYPRTVSQSSAWRSLGISANAIVTLQLDSTIALQRLVNRRIDPVTGDVYNVKIAPPHESVASRLTQRADDRSEIAASRLRTYDGTIQDITKSLDGVTREIMSASALSPAPAVFHEIKSRIEAQEQTSHSLPSSSGQT